MPRPRQHGLTAAATLAALITPLAAMLATSGAAQAQFLPKEPGPSVDVQLNTEATLTDLYAAGGPSRTLQRDVVPTTTISDGQWRDVQADLWRTDASGRQQQGAMAYARAVTTPEAIVLGTSAVARSDAGFSGASTSSLLATITVKVLISPRDPILQGPLFELSPCFRRYGCVLETSFLHETHGQFAWLQGAGDRSASFSETVQVAGSEGTAQSATGSVTISLRNNVADATVSTRGSFGPADLGVPRSTALPDIYPGGDPRNRLGDPSGPLTVMDFHHQQTLLAVSARFYDSSDHDNTLEGTYTVSVSQLAMAGIGPDYFNRSTLAVDFADTARFSGLAVVDPSGQLPLDLLDVRFSFTSPVPEPAVAWLWALAGPLLWVAARRQRGGTV